MRESSNSAYTLFCREMEKYPALQPEETRSLLEQFEKTGDIKIKQKIVRHNLRLVLFFTNKYQKTTYIQDLIQEGNIGLMHAVDKFDSKKESAFSTYASWWIRAAVLRYLKQHGKMIRFGTTEMERKFSEKLAKKIGTMDAAGQIYTDESLAASMQIPVEFVRQARGALSFHTVSINDYQEDGNTPAIEIPDDTSIASTLLIHNEAVSRLRGKLAEFKKSLNPRNAVIFEKRFLQEDPSTLEEVGQSLNLTRQRIQQIETELKKRLEVYLQEFVNWQK